MGEAEALARALDDRARLGQVLTMMANGLRITGDHDGAMAVGQQALELAVALGDSALQVQAAFRLGQACYAIGDFSRAAELLRRNVEATDRASGTSSTDVRIRSQAWLALTLGALGAFAEGRRHGEEALRLAEGRALLEEGISEGIRTGGLLNHSLWVVWLSEVCRLAGRGEEAWQHARQALDLARQQKARGDEVLALHQLGVVYAHAAPSDVAQAEAHYQQALALADELGMRPLVAHCHLGLGRLYVQTGRAAPACAALATAIALYRAMDMTFWLPQAEAALAQVA